jgi:hypothetical protein
MVTVTAYNHNNIEQSLANGGESCTSEALEGIKKYEY